MLPTEDHARTAASGPTGNGGMIMTDATGVGGAADGSTPTEQIDAELTAARQQCAEADRAASRTRALQTQVGDAAARCETLERAHAGEARDVERLEGVSLTRLIVAMSGHKQDRLDAERAQRDAAALRLATERSILEGLRRDLAAAQAVADQLPAARDRYRRALAAKQAAIEASNDPRAAQLHNLTEQSSAFSSQVKELDEARSAAQGALAALRQMASCLASASNWSTVDLSGGGLISSAVKHSRLDEANAAAGAAQASLDRLAREMTDVAPVAGWQLPDISGGQRFVDVWFDNVFTDWSVARKISDSRANVDGLIERVNAVDAELESRRAAIIQQWRAAETTRTALLDGAT
jgi:hypothetical protein